jgi:hypothetical protein
VTKSNTARSFLIVKRECIKVLVNALRWSHILVERFTISDNPYDKAPSIFGVTKLDRTPNSSNVAYCTVQLSWVSIPPISSFRVSSVSATVFSLLLGD